MFTRITVPVVVICCLIFSCRRGFSLEPGEHEEKIISDSPHIAFVKKKFDDLDLEVIQLKNGMVVFLKGNDSDDEITVRLTAMGGYSFLPCSQRASGEISPGVALRSGPGDYTYNQLQAFLYQHSIDFNFVINPFSRVMEGSTIPNEIENLLSLINICFTRNDFSLYSFNKIIEKERIKIANRSKDLSRSFEDACLSFTSQNYRPLLPLTKEDLDQANFHLAEQFFKRCVADPSQFVCVIVGPFDSEQVRSLIVEYLAKIPKNPQPQMEPYHPLPLIPKGKRVQVIPHFNRSTSMTKLTFPIQIAIDERNIGIVESLIKLLEMTLKKSVEQRINESIEIQVRLAFPFNPSPEKPWFTIQYLCHPKFVDPVREVILSELKCLQDRGVETEDLATFKKRLLLDSSLSSKDNYFWAAILSNYFLRNWDPRHIPNNHRRQLEEKQTKRYLKDLYSLDHYTIVSTKP